MAATPSNTDLPPLAHPTPDTAAMTQTGASPRCESGYAVRVAPHSLKAAISSQS